VRIALPGRPGDPPLRVVIRFAWVVVLIVAIVATGHHHRADVTVPLLVIAALGWAGWAAAFAAGRMGPAALALVALATSGAVIGLWSSVAVGFLAASAVAAATTFDLRRAVPLALVGPVVLAVASSVHGWSRDLVIGGTAAALAGIVGGASRRQAELRTQQLARTELARELHDVLAHTLSALAVQLEAAEAVVETGNVEKLRELIGRSRRLVAEGIDEAAGAVRALREEPVAIVDRIAALVAEERIPFHVEGTPRELPPEAGLALYRAAQEALTNARKHAPRASTSVSLLFRSDTTVVTVTNGAADTAVSASGSGLGLQGMRERLELAGGTLETAASADGWRVEATVPA
jgi:signal transduction histidine kinase